MRPDEILEQAARMFRERNAFYGDTHLQIGNVLSALHPDLFGPPLFANREFLITQIANKLTRYVSQLDHGGHKDSARDIIVYAAMLEALTDETRSVLASSSDGSRAGETPQDDGGHV